MAVPSEIAAQKRESYVAGLLIGPSHSTPFIELRPPKEDTSPINILWGRLKDEDPTAMRSMVYLLAAGIDRLNVNQGQMGEAPINVIVGTTYGRRFSKAVANVLEVPHYTAKEGWKVRRDFGPSLNHGIKNIALIDDWLSKTDLMTDFSSNVGRSINGNVIALLGVVGYHMPTAIYPNGFPTPVRTLTTVSAILEHEAFSSFFPEAEILREQDRKFIRYKF